jgi:hypothetical protein
VASLTESIRKFLDDLTTDGVSERVVEYVVREVGNGRKLEDELADPYVKNRLSEQKVQQVLASPEILGAVEASIKQAFEEKDFGFLS